MRIPPGNLQEEAPEVTRRDHRKSTPRCWLAALLLLLLAVPSPSHAAPRVQDSAPQAPQALPTRARAVWELPDWTPEDSGEPVANFFRNLQVDGVGPGEAQVRAITNNVEAWWTRWWLLDKARHSIDITYFIIEDDVFGLSLLGLLAKKAREGVRIRFMLDSRGSKSLSSVFLSRGYLREISKLPNVDVRVFNPLHKALLRLPKDVRHVVASNHDKILLVDGEWVLTGGRNISRDYFASRQDYPEAFRDTDILLRGEAAASKAFRAFNEEYFVLKNGAVETRIPKWNPRSVQLELARQVMDHWIKNGQTYDLERIGSKLRPLARALHEELRALPALVGYLDFDPQPSPEYHPVHLLDKSSLAHNVRNDILPNLIRMIDSAEHHIMIQNPYVILTREMRGALQRANDRGVKLFIHTNGPASTDHLLTQAFFLREWKTLMASMENLRIFVSPGPGPLHSKVMLIDDRISVIGTYNLDALSQSINSEILAVVESRSFTQARRAEVIADLRRARQWKIEKQRDGSIRVLSGPTRTKKGFEALISSILARWPWFRGLV